jgi:hypothetical protein
MEELFDFEITPEEMLVETTEETPIEEVEEVIEKTPDEIEEVEENESNDEPSDGVKVFYDFITESGVIDEIENFDGSIEMLKQELESLPVKSFKKAVSSLPEFAQQVLNYVFSKEDITVDDFKSFIESDVEPVYKQFEITDVEEARKFLSDEYQRMGIYTDEEDLSEAIDLLEEKGTLLKTAKQLSDKRNAELKQVLDAKIQETEKQKEERTKSLEEENKRISEGIQKTLTDLKWKESRKQAIFENLKPDVLQKKNELIRRSPKAIVQLADLYSYFDEEKGEFDLSKLVDAKANSKITAETKNRMQEDKFSSAIAGLGKQLPNRKEKSILEVVDFEYEE